MYLVVTQQSKAVIGGTGTVLNCRCWWHITSWSRLPSLRNTMQVSKKEDLPVCQPYSGWRRGWSKFRICRPLMTGHFVFVLWLLCTQAVGGTTAIRAQQQAVEGTTKLNVLRLYCQILYTQPCVGSVVYFLFTLWQLNLDWGGTWRVFTQSLSRIFSSIFSQIKQQFTCDITTNYAHLRIGSASTNVLLKLKSNISYINLLQKVIAAEK